ncbi:BAG domain-containing protein Samui [Anopheles aquasalis]|nr:BAG domain-containing protein Samui [Anopheles aquasalis]
MSQQQEPSQQPQQPTVRHIPIYVEGRSEPLVNTSPESQPSSAAHHHQSSSSSSSSASQPSAHHHPSSHHPTGMDSPGMDMPSQNDFFKQNSIFDRVRDIPVRSNFSNPFFKREPSPGAHRTSPFADMGSHMPHTNVPHRGSSIPRQTPSPPTTNSWHSQPQQKPAQPSNAYQQQQYAPQRQPPQQQQQSPQPQHHHPEENIDQPDSHPKYPAKDDPIVKIQMIQKDVLAIFDQVEKFRGTKEGKKDKAYMYLDEMLTQNLLKLDSIDAGDQPQIKSARKEAIKSINTCIAVLEQKAEAGALEGSSSSLGGRNDSSNGIDTKAGVNGGVEQQSAADRSASNTSITHSSSNSSQQHQQQQPQQ